MRTLILMRHAKAVPDDPAGDHARPLSGRGHGDAVAAGIAVATFGPLDLALVSDAKRTRETLDGVVEGLGQTVPHRFVPRLYAATPEAILAEIGTVPETTATLLVLGHNPGLGDLARRLAAAGDRKARDRLAASFPTPAFAVLAFDATGWADLGAGRLLAFVTGR